MMTPEQIIMTVSALFALFLLIFAVNWHYFRDWTVLFLYQGLLDFIWGSPVVSLKLIKYPVRLLPHYYETSILFELWVLPVLCILYNQATRHRYRFCDWLCLGLQRRAHRGGICFRNEYQSDPLHRLELVYYLLHLNHCLFSIPDVPGLLLLGMRKV